MSEEKVSAEMRRLGEPGHRPLPAGSDEDFALLLATMAASLESTGGFRYDGTSEEIILDVVRDTKAALDRLTLEISGNTPRARAIKRAFGHYLPGTSGVRRRPQRADGPSAASG